MMVLFLVKTSIILLFATIATALMRRSSAASRHVVWTTALLAVLMLPLAGAIVPELPLRVLPVRELAAAPSAPVQVLETALTVSPSVSPANVPPSVGPFSRVALLWLAGSLALLIRLGRSYQLRWRLLQRSVPCADSRVLYHVAPIRLQFGITRPCTVVVADTDMTPATWGLTRPCLLLPPSSCDWTDERLSAVLTHELAHVARLDVVAQGVAQAAAILTWWNPLVWAAIRRAQFERERACDDAVLRTGMAASSYADTLLNIAQTLPSAAGQRLSLAMADPRRIEQRLTSILDPTRSRKGTSHLCAALTSVLLAMHLPLAAAQLEPIRVGQLTVPPEMIPTEITVPADTTISSSVAKAILQMEDFSGTWEPLPEFAGPLAELFDARIAPIRGRFTVVQTPSVVQVLQSWPEGNAKLSLFPLVQIVYTPTEWVNRFSLKGTALVAYFGRSGPMRFRRVSPTATPAPARPAQQPMPEKPFGDGAVQSGRDGVSSPVRLAEVRPVYTQQAMKAGIQGIVELQAVIGTDGKVTDVRVTKSLDRMFGLDTNAIDSVRRTSFAPCKRGDTPVPCLVVFELQYTLKDATPIPAGEFGAGAYRVAPRSGVESPVRLREVKPQYTAEAMRQKIEGIVKVEAVILADGSVGDVRIVESLDTVYGLDQQAIKSLRASTFTPGTLNGLAVPVVVAIEMRFTLR